MTVEDDFTNCESDIRLEGKVALVTEATSQIGYETAKNFASRGARVIIASDNATKLENARIKLIGSTGNANIVSRQMEFQSLASVRNFVNEMYTYEPQLDILVNNINSVGLQDRLTDDGLHLMMQVNYFSTFLLTFLLFPLLKCSAPSRIVNVSSLALLLGQIEIDQMNDVGRYSTFDFYANAKLANVLFTVEMDKRIRGSGVSVYSMDPGVVQPDRVDYQGIFQTILSTMMSKFGRPVDRTATMPVFLAVDPGVARSSGKHFRDCAEFYSTWYANDTLLTSGLWEKSKELVGIRAEEDWERNVTF